VIWKPNYILKT